MREDSFVGPVHPRREIKQIFLPILDCMVQTIAKIQGMKLKKENLGGLGEYPQILCHTNCIYE